MQQRAKRSAICGPTPFKVRQESKAKDESEDLWDVSIGLLYQQLRIYADR